MHKITFTIIAIFAIALLIGCGGNEETEGDDSNLTDIGEVGDFISGDDAEIDSRPVGKTATVTATALNVRSEASTTGKVIGTVSKDEVVTIEEEGAEETIGGDTGVWYKISTSSGINGWVFGAYLRIEGSKFVGSAGGTDTSLERPGRADETRINYDAPSESGLSASEYHSKGKDAESTGDNRTAIGYYGKAAEMEPKSYQYNFDLGMLLGDMGRNAEAASAYEKAIEAKPDNFWAHNNLGLACINSNQPERAIVVLEKAITLDPKGSMDKGKARGIAERNLEAARRMTGQ